MSNYQIIVLEDHEIIGEDIWAVFDKKCSDALSADEGCIAIFLRSEMGSGVPLLDWIEIWQEKFLKAGKYFYVISNEPQQLESMELSNPEQNLNYVSSTADFEDCMKTFSMEALDEQGIKEEKKQKLDQEKDLPSIEKKELQTIFLAVGDTVTIAGEYLCESCGISRMWMKGRKVSACVNPECFESSKGWKLDYDLF